jgi:putative endonuclease
VEEWFVYILECADNTLYVGTTNDIEKRVIKHNTGKGAKYTRGRGPVKVIYSRSFESRAEACAEEYRLKRYSRNDKLAIVEKSKLKA